MKIEMKSFGKTALGEQVDEYILSDGYIKVSLISYGAAIRAILLPDGKDIVLGFDSIEDYEKHDKYMGATVGRCANRISNGKFKINDKEYTLAVNNGPNHLHGGIKGFDKKVWNCQVTDNAVQFSISSGDMEEGYPGNLQVKAVYKLDNNRLSVDYFAVSDKDTIINLTNHVYFNLNGHDSGNIEEHLLKIHADRFTKIDENGCSNGEITNVEGTNFDFRKFIKIGERIDADCDQINFAHGYDQNFILKDAYNEDMIKAVEVKGNEVSLTIYTNQTGVHFYSGNYLDEKVHGKGNTIYHKRSGFALETQNWPDAINQKDFPNAVTKVGETYNRTTVYEIKKILG